MLMTLLSMIFFTIASFAETQESIVERIQQWEEEFQRETVESDPSQCFCKKLEHMAKVDQALREFLVEKLVTSDAPNEEKLAFLCSMINFKRSTWSPDKDGLIEKYDRKHYEELKKILAENQMLKDTGWPTISSFGQDADFHAWLICQHASFDREWQKMVLLPKLKNLLAMNEISPAGYAWLSDPSLENLDAMETILAKQGLPWSSMIPQIQKMRLFFKVVESLLSD